MWVAIATVLLGGLGWGIAYFLFEPLREIVDLRREAQECLIMHGNIAKDAPPDERRTAADAFRRVGAGLVSRHLTAYPWVAWSYGRWLGHPQCRGALNQHWQHHSVRRI